MASRAAPTQGVFVWNLTTAYVVGVGHEREKIIQAVVKNGLGLVQVWDVKSEVPPPNPPKTANRVWARCCYTEWNELNESQVALDYTGLQQQVFYRAEHQSVIVFFNETFIPLNCIDYAVLH